ncbi:hypothetical protein C0993_008633 [Termitomyces sp. T159_Od127]|nr:hypothetical protein C0993_008633 [Termitomyces sp. T159_Od127]
MSDKIREFLDVPQQFVHDGNQVCRPTPRTPPLTPSSSSPAAPSRPKPICKAVAIGFGVMGFIGYFVKLIHIPINNILVGGA